MSRFCSSVRNPADSSAVASIADCPRQQQNFFEVAVGELNNPDSDTYQEALPTFWVFGTELPVVVIDQVLSEYEVGGTRLIEPVWKDIFQEMGFGAHGEDWRASTPIPASSPSSWPRSATPPPRRNWSELS